MNTNFVFDRIKKATRTAFDRVATVSDISNDPELRIYDTFKPEDFERMIEKFGPDETLTYIQQMEGKRLKGG